MAAFRSTLYVLLATFLSVILGEPDRCPAAQDLKKASILVVTSHNTPPYQEMLAGFKAEIAKRGIQAEISAYSLDENPGGTQLVEKIPRDRTSLLFAIGSKALDAVSKVPPEIPILTGLIPTAPESGTRGNVTGVTMEFPVEDQFEKIRQFLPNCRNIGVVYGPPNASRIEHATKVAARMGFTLHGRQIAGPSDLPAALDHLANRVEILWGIPDELVFTPQTAKHILLYSLRNRIPLAGLSGVWTKAGALYSLEWDYQDMGAQCAEMGARILGGTSPGKIPFIGPRKMVYSLNLKTAAHMKLEIPESIEKSALLIFR
ncbi:MAG: hypothetical protein LLG06_00790 [Desulfobacteraceae bacterium]|nr:hypothetical protein [Desulfobacteraceae bacterium]